MIIKAEELSGLHMGLRVKTVHLSNQSINFEPHFVHLSMILHEDEHLTKITIWNETTESRTNLGLQVNHLIELETV